MVRSHTMADFTTIMDVSMVAFCLSLSLQIWLYRNIRKSDTAAPQAYILHNRVTHSRFLPTASSHSFTYPTLSLLLSLNALENNSLDLARGWVFGYGGLWGRLIGLRAKPYLTAGDRASIKEKLLWLLKDRGYAQDIYVLEDVWMMTMPSFLGYEGINPLTVYFCYKPGGEFWITVLEIHNTFGESHAHVLESGQNEDASPKIGFDHQWTISREFHVSPFNDRSGYYTVSVKRPTHPPTCTSGNHASPPRPTVLICLHTPANSSQIKDRGSLKLSALLRPTVSTPLSTPSLLLALACAPFTLLLTFPRILFQAWILHYRRRLDVYIRPEPHPAAKEWEMQVGIGERHIVGGEKLGGGIKWLEEGFLERWARKRVEKFLDKRVDEIGITVTLVPADPSCPRTTFSPTNSNKGEENPYLTIHYMCPRFFVTLLLSPSAAHALLLGSTTERIFFPSSADLFLIVFSSPQTAQSPLLISPCQRIRLRPIPPSLPLPVPPIHLLDADNPRLMAAVIRLLLLLDNFERWVFKAVHARTVPGHEPWGQWERAAQAGAAQDRKFADTGRLSEIGSAQRWIESPNIKNG